jgi:hypothetical protein
MYFLLGDLVVFGGFASLSYDALGNLEYFNGTTWVTEPLKNTRAHQAMVQLPCPTI